MFSDVPGTSGALSQVKHPLTLKDNEKTPKKRKLNAPTDCGSKKRKVSTGKLLIHWQCNLFFILHAFIKAKNMLHIWWPKAVVLFCQPNSNQAAFPAGRTIKNCVTPRKIFVLKCFCRSQHFQLLIDFS